MTSDPQSSPEETIVLTKADETPVKEFLTQAMIIYGIKDTSPSKILEIVGNQHNTMIKTINTQGQEIIESQKECAKEISDQLVLLREQNKELQEKNQALVKGNTRIICSRTLKRMELILKRKNSKIFLRVLNKNIFIRVLFKSIV